jgi:hypothetical protein
MTAGGPVHRTAPRQNLWEDSAEPGPVRRWRQTLITLLLLVIVGAVVWKFIAPGERFLPEFARVLTEPTIQRGPRDVALRLQLKRNRYGQGYLVVAVRTGGEPALNYDDIDARAGKGTEVRLSIPLTRSSPCRRAATSESVNPSKGLLSRRSW